MNTDRPNILWLTYEDTSPQFVSCYGHTPVVTTPTIDHLASEGVRFDNAFATAPVCSASRSAIITGCCNQATGLGHHRSRIPIPQDLLRGFPAYLRGAGYYATNNSKTDYNIENESGYIERTWDESSNRAHWRNRRDDQPFFSVFNFVSSHQSRTMTHPWRWYEQHVLQQLPEEEIISPEEVRMPPIYRDTAEMRRHVSRVYNSLRLCDREMSARIEELRSDGLLEDTIIFCFADHGEGMPRGKTNAIGFGYRASFVVWCPEQYTHLIPWAAGTTTDELISFEDLAPTVLSLAGTEVPEHMTGRPVLGEQRTPAPEFIFSARDRLDDTPDLCRSAMDGRFVYTRNFYPHLPVVKYQKYADVSEIQRAIRKDYAREMLTPVQAELLAPTRPTEYLFDLKNDPWEIRNLADAPEFNAELQRLREATFRHIREVCDVMFLPETEMIDKAAGSTPYELRSRTDYNPLAKMLEAARLVGGGAAPLPRQLELLNADIPGVRYWAAVGLYASRREIVPYADAIRRHLQDPAPFVVTEIAAALYAATRDDAAKTALEQLIQSDNRLIAHQAVEKLLYVPEMAPDFSAAIQAAQEKLDNNRVRGPGRFSLDQALEMYRYLYEQKPLFYENMEEFLSDEDRMSGERCGPCRVALGVGR